MKYSNYILHKVIIGFAGFVSILVALIWFSRAISFVQYITENGIELSKFFYLFILILPWLLLFIVPISLFAAIVVIYNRLISSNEITILKNSGLTKFSIYKPIVSFAILISLFCFLISFFLMPYANRQLRIIRSEFNDNYANLAFNPKTFETLKNLTIYAKNRGENNKLFGILLHDERSNKYSITMTAKNGVITSSDEASLLYMEDGTIQRYNYDEKKTEILNFDTYVFNLTEGGGGGAKNGWKAKERYFTELMFPEVDAADRDLASFRSELHQRFTYPLLPILFSMIAVAFILRGEFNRSGKNSNSVLAIFAIIICLAITISSYKMIETSAKFTPILYVNLIGFLLLSLKMLKEK